MIGLGLLAKLGGGALTVLGRTVGTHLIRNHLAGLGIGTLQALIEGLGWRGIAGAGIALYSSNDAFRAGIDTALKALF